MAEVIRMPKLGFDMAEGTLVRWLKREGEPVAKGEILAEIETDKATVEVESSATGTVRRLIVGEHSTVPVGSAIAIVGSPEESIEGLEAQAAPGAPAATPAREAAPEAATVAPVPAAAPGSFVGGVRASPLARRLASERGIDLGSLHGTGPEGRITKKDVPSTAGGVSPVPVPTAHVGEQAVPLSRLRGAIGRRMAAAKQQVPHFYLTIDVDAERLMDLRDQLNSQIPEDHKLSVNDFILKAAALALREVPGLNASLQGESILRHAQVNLGVAVALEEGLLTVVVRDVDRKPLRAIADELRAMVARARDGRVRPEDIEGSTFTVSNLGMFDIDEFIAIINPPEAGILAVGSVRQTPVVQDGKLVAGRRLKVTLSADHRVTDGAEGAHWLQALRGYLEHPARLML